LPITLENKDIRLLIQKPGERYQGSRFDWCGQISEIHYQDTIQFCSSEILPPKSPDPFGFGLHNEFGTETALGFEECPMGEDFIKIGVGLMKKDYSGPFDFFRQHSFIPFPVEIQIAPEEIVFSQKSSNVRGYAYYYRKTITFRNDGFLIDYYLENTGSKPIINDEYCHNFLLMNQKKVSSLYSLKMNRPLQFGADTVQVNPDEVVEINADELHWKRMPQSDFYFANFNQNKYPDQWILYHKKLDSFISERVSFSLSRMKIWGNDHSISPEMFKMLRLAPGESDSWQRIYKMGRGLP